MTAGLRLHPMAGIDEDDRELTGGGAGGHVPRVLLVAGRVGDDELALVGREITVGDIDGDALLALGLEAVGQEREIHLSGHAGRAELGAIALHGGKLILVDHLGIVQEPTDERGFSIVDGAARQKAKQFLFLMAIEIGVDIFRFRRYIVHVGLCFLWGGSR